MHKFENLEKQQILIWAFLRETLIMWVLDCNGVSGLFIKDQLIKVQIFPEQLISQSCFIYEEVEVQHFSLAVPTSKKPSLCSWKCCSDRYLWPCSLTQTSAKSLWALTSECFRSAHLTLRTELKIILLHLSHAWEGYSVLRNEVLNLGPLQNFFNWDVTPTLHFQTFLREQCSLLCLQNALYDKPAGF